MATWLSYPDQPNRCETDAGAIENLLRKGWQITEAPPDPEPDPLVVLREALAQAFDAIADDEQAAFFSTRLLCEQALDRGKVAVARALIEQAAIQPELEPLRAHLLTIFSN